METVPRFAPLAGLVAAAGLILAVPILGLTLAGVILDHAFGTGPVLSIGSFIVGNIIGWFGIRWLYLRERRRFARP